MIRTTTSLILTFALAAAVMTTGLPGGYHEGEMEDCQRVLKAAPLENKSYLKNQKIVVCLVQIVAGRNFFIQVEPKIAFRDSKSRLHKPKTTIKIFEGLDQSLTVGPIETENDEALPKLKVKSNDESTHLLGVFTPEKNSVCKKAINQLSEENI